MNNKILHFLEKGNSIVIVGPTNSGKTWYIKNELMPFLKSKKLQSFYIKDSLHDFKLSQNVDIIIADEFETLTDEDFLTSLHPDEQPYYKEGYLNIVGNSHARFKKITPPIIFVITRNKKEEIGNLLDNLKIIDSGQPVETFKFDKDN